MISTYLKRVGWKRLLAMVIGNAFSLSRILTKRLPKISYFWNRIITDAICTLICFFAGGIVGVGTLVSALGLGPVIDFFTVHFTRKLFGEDEDIL